MTGYDYLLDILSDFDDGGRRDDKRYPIINVKRNDVDSVLS